MILEAIIDWINDHFPDVFEITTCGISRGYQSIILHPPNPWFTYLVTPKDGYIILSSVDGRDETDIGKHFWSDIAKLDMNSPDCFDELEAALQKAPKGDKGTWHATSKTTNTKVNAPTAPKKKGYERQFSTAPAPPAPSTSAPTAKGNSAQTP
jgi:hypothetical protein